MNSFVDNVLVNVTSAGTGPFALGTAVAGYDGIDALANGQSYSYTARQGSNFEAGVGTFVSASNTLTRVVTKSSNANQPVAFDVNLQVGFTFTAEDIAALAMAASTTGATAKAAFNAYGIQWGVWFNATPGSEELLALYTSPIAFQYPANFAGACGSAPFVDPATPYTILIERRLAGGFEWDVVGSVTIGVDGGLALATVGAAPVNMNVGDQLRALAPVAVDPDVVGFSITFKGVIP